MFSCAKHESWCLVSAELYSPEYYAAERVFDRRWHRRNEAHIVAVNCNFDGSKWNFNCNELDENGNWNEGSQFSSPETVDRAQPSNYRGFSLSTMPFLQPPSILPISSSCSPIVLKFLLPNPSALPSQATCTRNFKRSSVAIDSTIYFSFWSALLKYARYDDSKRFKNLFSILFPKENLLDFGI